MKRRVRALGFTLLELLVVVVILGILAAIALPRFTKAVERARISEANTILGSIRTAEELFFQENQTYTNSDTDLLVELPANSSALHFFKYRDSNGVPDITATATSFTATATRKTGTDTGKTPNYTTAYTVTIDQNGTITRTGP